MESSSGFVGLNIFHDDWSPAITVSHVLLSLLTFLDTPDPENAVVPEIAAEYEMNRAVFEDTAREWTGQFARVATQDGLGGDM